MKEMTIILLSALIGAKCVLADAVSIGHTRNGFPLIVPQPRELEVHSGEFSLPKKLTVAAPQELDMAPLAKVYAETMDGGIVERTKNVGEKELCRFEITNVGVPKSKEGYTFAVTSKGITVKGHDMHGLYNGMQTLNMLLRHRESVETIPCCTITDWPDLQMRGLFLQLAKCWSAPLFDVNRVCHVIDVLGMLKYNTLVVEFGDNFPYENSPFTKRQATFTREDVEKILTAARRNYMDVIPYMPLVKGYALMNHPEWEDMQEGKRGAYCLSNPKVQPLIEKCIRETADFIKPQYFHITLDEIELAGFPSCPKCKAANVEQLLRNHLMPIKKILDERGIIPIVYQDQFFGCAEPSGQKGLDICGVLDALGQDTIVNSWEYWHRPSNAIGKKIRNAGFSNLLYMSYAIDLGNSWRLPILAGKMNALGNILTYWSGVPPTLDWSARRAMPAFYPSTIAQANYCWNTHDVPFSQIPMDCAVLLRELLDGPLPEAFRGTASPLPLVGALNRALAADPVFPEFNVETAVELKRIAANDPAKFELMLKDGSPLAIVLSGCKYDGFAKEPVVLPVNATATGASFLLTAAAFNTFALQTSVYALKYIDIGALNFVYADGTAEELPLTFRRNINDWNSSVGTNCCRLVARGNDRNGSLFTLSAIDWRNPHPQKEIKEIILSSKGDTFISPVLLACSLSDAGGSPTGVTGAMTIASPALRTPVQRHPMVSFNRGVPEGTRAQGHGVGEFEYGMVHDLERGDVFELRAKDCQYLSRTLADIPVENPQDFESIIFDFKVSKPLAIFRPDCYVTNKAVSKYLGATGFYVDVHDKWYTACIPRHRFSPSGGGIAPEQVEMFSIRFFMQEWGEAVSIRISDVCYGDGVLPCRINMTDRAK